MSSILKALKKLEQEKIRREDGSLDIARDILKSHPRKKSSPWKGPVIAIGITLLTAGLILLYSSTQNEQSKDETLKHTDRPVVLTDNTVTDSAETKAVTPSPLKNIPDNTKVVQTKPTTDLTATLPVDNKTTEASSSSPPQKKTEADETIISIPQLVISGIAYQEDRTASLAIVNELPVMEGTFVEGALVEQILPDKVRFAYQGRKFEIPLE